MPKRSDEHATAHGIGGARCSTPRCTRRAAWSAVLAVRCTVDARRAVLWLPLPIVMCSEHRGNPSMSASIRRFAPAQLTAALASAGACWPAWDRARIVYVCEDAVLRDRGMDPPAHSSCNAGVVPAEQAPGRSRLRSACRSSPGPLSLVCHTTTEAASRGIPLPHRPA